MSYRSKSTLFLIEQLIVIAVFAICATACIRIVTNAYFYAIDSRDVSNALIIAESAADTIKAVAGDYNRAAELLGGFAESVDGAVSLYVYFDEGWQAGQEKDAHYVLRLNYDWSPDNLLPLYVFELSVEKVSGEELVSFPVAVIPEYAITHPN